MLHSLNTGRRGFAAISYALGLLAVVCTAMPLRAAEETATPVFESSLPNVPGKKIIAVRVDYPPGARSAPHTHAPSAFIFAYVLAGQIRSQVGDGPVLTYKAGESFDEVPGSKHRVSENASTTNPASMLAVFVVDDSDTPLTTPIK